VWSRIYPLFVRLAILLRGTVRPLRLTWQFSPEAQHSFERENREKRIAHYRFSMIVAILLYNSFLLMDYFCFPQRFAFCVAIRLGFATPFGILCFAVITRVGRRAREALLAASPIPGMVGVLAIYNGTQDFIATGQIALIIMMMYSINAMWPNFRYACFTIPLVALGDSIFLTTNPMLNAPRATVFSAQIWTAAGLSLLASYWMERQERVGFLLRLRIESQNTELARLSTMDSLTGIYNRRRFDSEFRSCWERCINKAQSMALLMIDLDHFKSLNDHHGHALGDAVLIQVAKTLRDTLRGEQDLVARYGGEEFVVILPNRSLAHAIKIAERLCAAVRAVALPIPRDGLSVRTTISIGAASVLPTSLSGAASLLQNADAALYRAKADGRDRVWPAAATAK